LDDEMNKSDFLPSCDLIDEIDDMANYEKEMDKIINHHISLSNFFSISKE